MCFVFAQVVCDGALDSNESATHNSFELWKTSKRPDV